MDARGDRDETTDRRHIAGIGPRDYRFRVDQWFGEEARCVVTIREMIRAYHGIMTGEHHRYRSWEHCYAYFHGSTLQAIAADRDHAALQLGFYLASWGMYRGSSFLLQHTYTVHRGVIDRLVSTQFSRLWEAEFGSGDNDAKLVPTICEAIRAVREGYRPFAPVAESRQASDTLVTKVILGTLGCLPACDRYFVDGFKTATFKYSYLNAKFVERVLQFCRENLRELREEQVRIERTGGIHYPLMKLVDMYFWQTGYAREMNAGTSPTNSEPADAREAAMTSEVVVGSAGPPA